jgi:hypothetical protein
MVSLASRVRPVHPAERLERYADYVQQDYFFQECLPLKNSTLDERIRVLFAKAERIRRHLTDCQA